jgi:hypothetical protein
VLIVFFVQVGTIMLTHELNNYTMQEAINFHPTLGSSFKVFAVLLPFNCRKSDLSGMYQYLVPVGVSLNKTQPYVETGWSLPTFEECTLKHGKLLLDLTFDTHHVL